MNATSAESLLAGLRKLAETYSINRDTDGFIEQHKGGFRLLNELGIGVFVWDYVSGKMQFAGSSLPLLLGFKIQQMPSFQDVWSCVHAEDRNRILQLLQNAIPKIALALSRQAKEIHLRFHFRIVTKAQGQQWVMSHHKLLQFEGRQIDLGTLTPLSVGQLNPHQTLNIEVDGIEEVVQAEQPAMLYELFTTREQEILRLSLEGRQIAEIAQVVGLTAAGVRFHRKKILRKSAARSITELRRRMMN